MPNDPIARDPFSSVADPRLYVPRDETDRALRQVEGALTDPQRGLVALLGPTGIGKSLLVRVLGQRVESSHRFAYLTTGSLPADQLCESALDLLGDAGADDPEGALVLRATAWQRRGRPVILVLDHADGMALETARRLAELWSAAMGALRLLLVLTERPGVDELIDAFAGRIERVALRAPMSAAETSRYIEARLAATQAPRELRQRLDPQAQAQLYERSRGNPLRLHAEINEIQLELWREGHMGDLGLPATAEPPPEPLDVEVPPPVETVEPKPSAAPPALPEPADWPPAFEDGPRQSSRKSPPRRARRAASGRRTRLAVGLAFALGLLGGWALTFAWYELRENLDQLRRLAPVSAAPTALVRTHINADPWAVIHIDGAYMGETPLAGVRLAAGPHHIQARMPDGRLLERTVVLDARSSPITFP